MPQANPGATTRRWFTPPKFYRRPRKSSPALIPGLGWRMRLRLEKEQPRRLEQLGQGRDLLALTVQWRRWR